MRDDEPGGSSEQQVPADYVQLRIATFAWRLRLSAGTVAAVDLMAGESTALLFVAALGVVTVVFMAASVLGRIETRFRQRRVAR